MVSRQGVSYVDDGLDLILQARLECLRIAAGFLEKHGGTGPEIVELAEVFEAFVSEGLAMYVGEVEGEEEVEQTNPG